MRHDLAHQIPNSLLQTNLLIPPLPLLFAIIVFLGWTWILFFASNATRITKCLLQNFKTVSDIAKLQNSHVPLIDQVLKVLYLDQRIHLWPSRTTPPKRGLGHATCSTHFGLLLFDLSLIGFHNFGSLHTSQNQLLHLQIKGKGWRIKNQNHVITHLNTWIDHFD